MQGETGQSKLSYFPSLEDAKKDFEKKFRDKTKNSWANRDPFVAHPGKYTLIEVQGGDEAQEAVVKVKGPGRVGGREPETTARCATSGTDLPSGGPVSSQCPALLPRSCPAQLPRPAAPPSTYPLPLGG